MKSSFTLIELLISFTILAVISGGALMYLNNFNAQQNLDKVSNEVVSSLKLSHSYAKTKQVPIGSAETELTYIQVQMVGSGIVARASGIGETFFDIKINNNGIGVSFSPGVIYFWAGNGFLSHDGAGEMYGAGETVTITVQSQNNFIGYNAIIVDALGQVKLISYNEGVLPSRVPTAVPTTVVPTVAPTTTIPTVTPVPVCRLGGVACGVHSDCCSYYCSSGACLGVPSATPTLSCKLGGVACGVHGDCCSYYCNLNFCN